MTNIMHHIYTNVLMIKAYSKKKCKIMLLRKLHVKRDAIEICSIVGQIITGKATELTLSTRRESLKRSLLKNLEISKEWYTKILIES